MTPRLALPLLLLSACPRDPASFAEPPADGVTVTDPVDRSTCKKDPMTAAGVVDERTYYLCSPETAARFRADPRRFADP